MMIDEIEESFKWALTQFKNIAEESLQLACENDIDVICVQEPWINDDLSRTVVHPWYQTIASLTWHTRPRSLIYVKHNIKTYSHPLGTCGSKIPTFRLAIMTDAHDHLYRRYRCSYAAGMS